MSPWGWALITLELSLFAFVLIRSRIEYRRWERLWGDSWGPFWEFEKDHDQLGA